MSGDPRQFTDEHAKEKAQKEGLDIEYSDDYTLQLDLDTIEANKTFLDQISMLKEVGVVKMEEAITVKRSKSGNRHVIIKLTEPLMMTDRILLQATLGSDLKRELLSYAGMKTGQLNPVLLFRPKQPKLLSALTTTGLLEEGTFNI